MPTAKQMVYLTPPDQSLKTEEILRIASSGTGELKKRFEEEYRENLETWGPHCGASVSTFKGHLDALLRAHTAYLASVAYETSKKMEKL